MTDHVSRCGAASPARYRASSSSKAASMSSSVERDSRRDPVVGVDLDDAERRRCGRPRAADRGPIGADTTESEMLPAGGNDDKRECRGTDLGGGPHVRDLGISTVSDPDVHDPTAIVDGKVVGQDLGHRVPVAGREVRHEALVYSACRVFQLRCRSAELVESARARRRGLPRRRLQQRLIRSPSTVRDADHPPLGVEALLRGPVRHCG